jgi:hypothetical protein
MLEDVLRFVLAFFEQDFRPTFQGSDSGFNRCDWGFEFRSIQESFAGAFEVTGAFHGFSSVGHWVRGDSVRGDSVRGEGVGLRVPGGVIAGWLECVHHRAT